INNQPAGSDKTLAINTDNLPPGSYGVDLIVSSPEGYYDGAGSTTFIIQQYIPPSGILTVDPKEIRSGEKSTLGVSGLHNQCGGHIRVAYSASEGNISGTTYDSSAVQFDPSDLNQRKTATIVARLEDDHGSSLTSATIVVQKAASPQWTRLPDI